MSDDEYESSARSGRRGPTNHRSAAATSSSRGGRSDGRDGVGDDEPQVGRRKRPDRPVRHRAPPVRRNAPPEDEIDEATRDELGLDDNKQQAAQMREEDKRSTSHVLDDAIRAAAEAEKSGAQTLGQLAVQHDQMARMKDDLHATNESLTRSERVLKGMKSITGAIGNMFSSAPKSEAAPVTPGFAGGTIERKGADILAVRAPELIKKEGYLVKMGDVIKNWKNRFFVVDKNVLYYYEDDKAYKTKGITAAKGKISLSGLTITPYSDKQYGKKHCFGVKAANTDRTYILVAANEEERAAWMSALKEQDRRVSMALSAAKAELIPSKRTAAAGGDGKMETAQDRFNRSLAEEEEEQEKLGVLSGLVGNLSRQGDGINRELDVQNQLLDEIDAEVERTTVRIAKNTRVVNKITRDA